MANIRTGHHGHPVMCPAEEGQGFEQEHATVLRHLAAVKTAWDSTLILNCVTSMIAQVSWRRTQDKMHHSFD